MDTPIQLSVIMSSASPRPGPLHLPRKAHLETAVGSILAAQSELPLEVLVLDATAAGDLKGFFRGAFPDETRSGRLQVSRPNDRQSYRQLKNLGVEQASGAFLTFCDPTDRWTPARFERLADHLRSVDLVLGSDRPPAASTDPFVDLLFHQWLVPSSLVISRTLFEEIGGFVDSTRATSRLGKVVFPGSEEDELALTALLKLQESGRTDRWIQMYPSEVETAWKQEPEATAQMAQIEMLEQVLTRSRRWASVLNLARRTPTHYLPLLLKRLGGQTDPADSQDPGTVGRLVYQSMEAIQEIRDEEGPIARTLDRLPLGKSLKKRLIGEDS